MRTAMCIVWLALVVALLALVQGIVQAAPAVPGVRVDSAPVIDGDISDRCWEQAPSVSDFYFTWDGSKAPESTTAWVCYDEKYIYVAFHCRDSQPDRITAQQTKRGGDFGTDDWVGFLLDCYRDYQKIVYFVVTAGGVQAEQLQSGEAGNIQWKGDWEGKAKRVQDGYTVEMAVPFSILRYDPSRSTVGIAFARGHPRTDQEWWSPNTGPNTDPRNYYLWEGLQLPRQRSVPQLLGYSLLGMGEDNDSKRLGLDAKHAFTPSITGALTINPDFRNVEQAVDSIDFTYSERWLPEKRPFFLEGEDYFPTSRVFYPRRIEEVDVGGKAYGKFGNYSFGALHARWFDHADYSVLQVAHEWPAKASIFLAATQSNVEGDENTVARLSGGYRLYDRNDEKIQFAWHFANADAADGGGHGRDVGWTFFQWGRPRVLRWNFDYDEADSDYDPRIGLVGENDRRGYSGSVGLYDNPSKGKITYWNVSLGAGRWEHMDGSFFYDTLYLSTNCVWRRGTSVYLGAMTSHRPPNRDRRLNLGCWWGRLDLYRHGNAEISFGRMAGGDYLSYNVSQGWSFGRKLNLETEYEHSQIKPPSPEAYSADQLIATLAYDLDNERTLAGRLISSEGDTNFYLAYRQRVRHGFDAYVILGDPNAASTRGSLSLKLVRSLTGL